MIPFSSAELRFWINDKGCLTEIDIDLNSGDCSLSFGAEQLDDQGRYLITLASLNASGFCPEYPSGIPPSSYFELATRQAFGTIELQRADVSWAQCASGKLIVRPDLVLERVGAVDIEIRGVELTLEGQLALTHIDPSGECPRRP